MDRGRRGADPMTSAPQTPDSSSEALVETRGLTKRYGAFAALEDCSLRVERGEVFGLLGPNGAGKTTLLRLLMGFLRPTAGTATIAGLDCYRQSVNVHARVSYLPGEARLFRHMRGRGILRFFSQIRADGDYQRSLDIADRLKLDLSRQVSYMSTGMRQKLALAATLAPKTPLIILDEPTSNLDPTVRGEVLALVLEAKADGRTVIFSSHVLSEVEQACDRVCILRAGRLVHLQPMRELRQQHRIVLTLEMTQPLRLPEALDDGRTQVIPRGQGQTIVLTSAALPPLLRWVADLPHLIDVRIEPVGLQGIYDRFHAGGAAA
jgi:ABC-2 type transport system ATP-binding protein